MGIKDERSTLKLSVTRHNNFLIFRVCRCSYTSTVCNFRSARMYFICFLIGPTISLPATSGPFCKIRTLPSSLSSIAVLRISFIYIHYPSELSKRATSEGYMVLSLPRWVANNSMVSEYSKIFCLHSDKTLINDV